MHESVGHHIPYQNETDSQKEIQIKQKNLLYESESNGDYGG